MTDIVSLWDRRCTKCKQLKSFDEFPQEMKRGKRVYRTQCKACRSEQYKQYNRKEYTSQEMHLAQEKQCRCCGEVKSIDQFNKRKRQRDGHDRWCRDCQKSYYHDPQATIANKKVQRPPARPDAEKDLYLRTTYGITAKQYDAMFKVQGGKCAVCNNHEMVKIGRSSISLSVDHDHETGAVRSLLCHHCNAALGMLREDPIIIESLLNYINSYKEGT